VEVALTGPVCRLDSMALDGTQEAAPYGR